MEDRNNLPLRKNCEGYFLVDGKLLVKDSGKGFLIFPGGGIDENEAVEEGMKREAKEEVGVIVEDLSELGKVEFIWDDNWAKTEKQKERFNKFRGDEMHFFIGKIKSFEKNDQLEEDFWNEHHSMEIKEAIAFIENSKPFDEGIKEYREAQLKFLSLLNQQIENLNG